MSFDLSLARGLDYYTGLIYEVVSTEKGVGSVAAGGRYDNLVGMFCENGYEITCVGFSVGVERIFSILQKKQKVNKIVETQALVVSIGGVPVEEKMKVCSLLWKNGISAELMAKKKAKLLKQFEYAEKNLIPFTIILGGISGI